MDGSNGGEEGEEEEGEVCSDMLCVCVCVQSPLIVFTSSTPVGAPRHCIPPSPLGTAGPQTG